MSVRLTNMKKMLPVRLMNMKKILPVTRHDIIIKAGANLRNKNKN